MAALPLFPRSQTAFQYRVRSSDADICADIYQQTRAAASTSQERRGKAESWKGSCEAPAMTSDVRQRGLILASR